MSAKKVAAPLATALTVALLAFGGVASAKTIHVKEGSFGPLDGPTSIGVDNSGGGSAGDIYVSEVSFSTLESSVRQLEADGTPVGVELNGAETPAGFFGFINFETFQEASGAKVDGSTGVNAGDIFVPDVANGVVDVFNSNGTYVCQITGKATPTASECAGVVGSETPSGGISPLAVAIDPADGHLFVGDGGARIYEFNEAGEYVGEITDSHITEPGSLAVDSAGNLYLINGSPLFGGGPGVKLDASGNFVSVFVETPMLSVAVDQNSDHVYFGEGNEIYEFDAVGNELLRFDSGAFGVDVNNTSGQVYVTGFESGEIWSGDIVVPDVTTEPSTAVEETIATLHGQVDPAGGSEVGTCQFEYGTTTAYGSLVPCSPATPYASTTVVSANPQRPCRLDHLPLPGCRRKRKRRPQQRRRQDFHHQRPADGRFGVGLGNQPQRDHLPRLHQPARLWD